MLTGVRAKLGVVFIGFLLLVVGSVGATFASISAQTADALVINLAGRQRMLTQKMTKAVLGVARDPSSNYREELREAAFLFDTTLTALLDGGSAPHGSEVVSLPPTMNAALRTQLRVVTGLWGRFQQDLATLWTEERESAAFIPIATASP